MHLAICKKNSVPTRERDSNFPKTGQHQSDFQSFGIFRVLLNFLYNFSLFWTWRYSSSELSNWILKSSKWVQIDSKARPVTDKITIFNFFFQYWKIWHIIHQPIKYWLHHMFSTKWNIHETKKGLENIGENEKDTRVTRESQKLRENLRSIFYVK